MKITTGGAHWSENKSKTGQPGDSTQASIPDYHGEVSLHEYATDSEFNKRWAGYKLLRPLSSDVASSLAHIMINACNNANLGYSQTSRLGVQKNGTTSSTPTNCDCSSLMYQCLNEACNLNIMGTTSTLQSDFEKTQLFMNVITFESIKKTPPYNGDVLVKAGNHTEMVVAGNPREGNEDEILFSAGGAISGFSGDASSIYLYRLDGETEFNFQPRNIDPHEDVEAPAYFNNVNGYNTNGSYAWGRFSEIMKSECDLCRGMAKKWYGYTEDMYSRGVAPSLGAAMCYTNIKNNSDPGLVSIVEMIGPGYIYVSQVSPQTNSFEVARRAKTAGSWDLDIDGDGFYEYLFQGFIYNPKVSTYANSGKSYLQEFIANAEAQVGKNSTMTRKYTGVTENAAWSASFVTAVAELTGGILNVVIPKVNSASAYKTSGAGQKMGTWLDGPILGKYPTPQVGDIALYRNEKTSAHDKYYADKASIVTATFPNETSVAANNKWSRVQFNIVVGDCEGQVKKKLSNSRAGTLLGFYRPNWDLVDGTAEIYKYTSSSLSMYTQGTTIEDASIRDLSYAQYEGRSFKPSIQKTGITLCALNYTGLLANMYSVLAEVSTSAQNEQGLIANFWNNTPMSAFQLQLDNQVTGNVGGSAYSLVDTASTYDNSEHETIKSNGRSVTVTSMYGTEAHTETMTLTPTVQHIYDLLNKDISNPSGVIGIMANMYQETRWDLTHVNSSDGGSGLVQWTNTKDSPLADQMKEYCRSHGNKQEWYNNLSGQIEFLLYWVTTTAQYKEGMNKIRKTPPTCNGAEKAAYYFLHYMEIGRGNWGSERESKESTYRQGWARGVWTLFFGDKE